MRRRLLRAGLIVALALAALTYVAYEVARSYIPGLRLTLESELSKALRAEVIVGEAGLHLLPIPKVVLTGVTVRTRADEGKAASIERVLVRFAFLPLLEKKVVVEELDVQGVVLPADWLHEQSVRSPPDVNGRDEAPAPTPSKSPQNPWQVTVRAVRIQNALVSIPTAKGEAQVTLGRFTSSLTHDGKRWVFGTSALEGTLGRLPIAVAASVIVYDQAHSRVEIENSEIGAGDNHVQLSGTWGVTGGEVAVVTKALALADLVRRLPENLRPLIPTIPEGVFAGRLNIKHFTGGATRIEGALRADRIKDKSGGYSIDMLRLEKLITEFAADGLKHAHADVTLGSSRIAHKDQFYLTESASGDVKYSLGPRREQVLSGSIAVRGFEYRNPDVHLSDVTARAKDVRLEIDHLGGVTVSGAVDGSSVRVNHPNVLVHSVTNVSSPLHIRVPSKGGYEVKGPVSVTGGVVTVAGQELTDIDGAASIVVSAPLKTFRANKLKLSLNGSAIAGNGVFEMTQSKYVVSSAMLGIGHGKIDGSFVMTRDKTAKISAQVSAVNVALSDAAALAGVRADDKLMGTIKRVTCRVEANAGDLLRTLNGTGFLELIRGGSGAERFTQRLLGAVASIPLVGIPLRSRNEKALGAKNEVRGNFTFRDQAIHSEDIQLKMPSYTGTLSGFVTVTGAVQAKVDVVFLRESFSDLGLGFDKLGAMLGKAGKIEIPLRVSGNIADPAIEPDVAQLAKNNSGLPLLKSALGATRDIAKRAIGGVFGIFNSTEEGDKEGKPDP